MLILFICSPPKLLYIWTEPPLSSSYQRLLVAASLDHCLAICLKRETLSQPFRTQSPLHSPLFVRPLSVFTLSQFLSLPFLECGSGICETSQGCSSSLVAFRKIQHPYYGRQDPLCFVLCPTPQAHPGPFSPSQSPFQSHSFSTTSKDPYTCVSKHLRSTLLSAWNPLLSNVYLYCSCSPFKSQPSGCCFKDDSSDPLSAVQFLYYEPPPTSSFPFHSTSLTCSKSQTLDS